MTTAFYTSMSTNCVLFRIVTLGIVKKAVNERWNNMTAVNIKAVDE